LGLALAGGEQAARGAAMARALVLNASFEPLGVVSARRALVLVLSGKAVVLRDTGRPIHSARAVYVEPSVVRLERFVCVPRQRRVSLTRRAIFARDGHRCQYCGALAENIDHVVPRSRGGPHTWENVVASCRRCNARKEDRLPEELGLKLLRPPTQPPQALLLMASGAREEWGEYLGMASWSA